VRPGWDAAAHEIVVRHDGKVQITRKFGLGDGTMEANGAPLGRVRDVEVDVVIHSEDLFEK
jgi:hypothetical protein